MDWKLELVILPSNDIDRSKAFYLDQAGFDLIVDHQAGEDFRVVQVLPKGSGCAIAIMKNPAAAGSVQGLHLVVNDIDEARSTLLRRGIEASDYFHFDEHGQQPGPDAERRDYNTFFSFSDPDGNGWLVQEVKSRGAAV